MVSRPYFDSPEIAQATAGKPGEAVLAVVYAELLRVMTPQHRAEIVGDEMRAGPALAAFLRAHFSGASTQTKADEKALFCQTLPQAVRSAFEREPQADETQGVREICALFGVPTVNGTIAVTEERPIRATFDDRSGCILLELKSALGAGGAP